MKKYLIQVLVIGFALITLNGCSTVAGVGKDLQKAGQVVERKAENP